MKKPNQTLENNAPENRDPKTVAAFSNQWARFEGMKRDPKEVRALFDRFFSLFPWDVLPKNPVGFEMGCGTGRFAQFVAPKVKTLTCVDAAPDAIRVAKETLKDFDNVEFLNEAVGNATLKEKLREGSMDFGYSYGVLHHVPETQQAINDCVSLLKPGAPFLIYLYYRFDNRPAWFRFIWWLSDFLRRGICAMPLAARNVACDIAAATIYWPLAKIAKLAENLGKNVENFPLTDFRDATFARMRSNSRDRLGTPLEQRFTKAEMTEMLNQAGIQDVKFREGFPYWCAVGIKS